MDEYFACCVGSGRGKTPDGSTFKLMRTLEETESENNQDAGKPSEPPKLRPMLEFSKLYEVDFSPKGELGRGHFALVFRGKQKVTGTKIAAKRISRAGTKTETLFNEIKALARLSHPNIVKLYDVFYDDVYVVLVLEFLGGGELFARIIKGGAYGERDAAKHFRELASALAYMHANQIVHRDLKPENLVLAQPRLDSPIKISDFGLSKILAFEDAAMSTICGTKAYSAPEINFGNDRAKKGSKYNAKVDVWSLGMILYVILGAYHPFDPYGIYKDDEIWSRITIGDYDFNDDVWDTVSDQAKDLLCKMICIDPEQRLTMDQVLQHSWLRPDFALPSVNLKAVQNNSFRTKMGNDVDSQLTFGTTMNSTSFVTSTSPPQGLDNNGDVFML